MWHRLRKIQHHSRFYRTYEQTARQKKHRTFAIFVIPSSYVGMYMPISLSLSVCVFNFLIILKQCQQLTDGPEREKGRERVRELERELEGERECYRGRERASEKYIEGKEVTRKEYHCFNKGEWSNWSHKLKSNHLFEAMVWLILKQSITVLFLVLLMGVEAHTDSYSGKNTNDNASYGTTRNS